MAFTPFHDRGESLSIGGLTLENGNARIALYGRLDIRQDQESLKNLRVLRAELDAIMVSLERQKSLPACVSSVEVTHAMKNPFDN
ncbi:hypothetical protein [Acetobacter syzygii]|uniref:Uncharacterized protein n=1 Tax=Acetobacter syzygii TaxID=146476 RepID=A0A270B6B9_9PROT|nr:hypothetical protein [Acetobacter syzygii]NSL93005.1 hypothetical protein [Acetobacter syzygii]PAL20552.1 hypothetical protein B9K05_12965 [Acetobacter syzygii]PAL21096.1 hypothetical protein B9K04_13065 [Acetobacter syzygii]